MSKITIIGCGHGWEDAPTDGESWGVNHLITRRPVSMYFDLHDWEKEREDQLALLKAARERGEETNTPIMTQENYPLKEIIKEFQTDYFSNTVAYMIALAIYTGYDEIDLYGVNQEIGSEYIFEKGGVEYWLGIAKGRGINIAVHGERSHVLLTQSKQMYGFLKPQDLTGR